MLLVLFRRAATCIRRSVLRKRTRRADIPSAAAGDTRARAALGRDDVQFRIAAEEHATPVGYRGDFDGSQGGVVVGEFLVADLLFGHVEIVALYVDVGGVAWDGLASDAVLLEVVIC